MANDSKTILYVEDNPDNRLLIRRVLTADGFEVVEAEDAQAAFQIVETLHPDLILMDINLPEIDGYSLTAQLRQQPHLRKVPIIALTANVMRGDRERTLEAGCDGYIQKPIDIDQICQVIHRYLERGQS